MVPPQLSYHPAIRLFFPSTPPTVYHDSPRQNMCQNVQTYENWEQPSLGQSQMGESRITGDLVTFLHIKRVGDEFQPDPSRQADAENWDSWVEAYFN